MDIANKSMEEKFMNHEVKEKQDLLNAQGHIIEEGWARFPVWNYDRSKIKASAFKIKEWDYYSITNSKELWSLNTTMADLGFGALFSVSFIDLKKKAFSQEDAMTFFTFGKTGLKPSSLMDHNLEFKNKKMKLLFCKQGEKIIIQTDVPNMRLPCGKRGLKVDIELTRNPNYESMNIATSWKENRKCFYLNEKVNCMPVSGTLSLGNDKITLEKNSSWAVLDWGRGFWTRKNRWYWSSGSGIVEGKRFGFNLGYGFTDRSPASENVIFYDGKIHKLTDVEFHIKNDEYLKPWNFISSDKRFEAEFIPAVDRSANTNLGLIKSVQHQVFGFFSGQAVLDEGKIVKFENFPAFAEDVLNVW